MTIYINSPCRLVIKTKQPTKKLLVFNDKDCIYFRNCLKPRSDFEFNVNNYCLGNISFNVDCDLMDIKPVLEYRGLPDFPVPEHYKTSRKKFTYSFVPNLGTPARIFPYRKHIELDTEFKNLPLPVRFFMLKHEEGHQYYKTEEYCDIFATIESLKAGFNLYPCFWAVVEILKRNPENINRMKVTVDNLKKVNKATK